MNDTFNRHLLYKIDYISIFYYELGFIYIDWRGYLTVGCVKHGCEKILVHMIKLDCNFLLNDNRKVKGSWTQSIDWLKKDFFPRIVEKGLKKIAYLYSPYESAKYSLNRLLEVNDQYNAQIFEDFKPATMWLTGKSIVDEEEFLTIKTTKNYSHILIRDIYYISTHNKRIVIQLKDEQHYTNKSLYSILKKLPQPQFFRIHKSYIINVEKISHIKYHAGGYYHLNVKDLGKVYFTVGRKYVKGLKDVLNMI